MKAKNCFLNTVLAVVLCAVLLICVIVRTLIPAVILPELNLPNTILLSLIALLVDHYAGKSAKRCYVSIALLAAVTFGLLPWASGMFSVAEAVRLAVFGGIAFTVTTLLFTSMQDRLTSGPAAKAAPIVSALCMYCAAQCLTGILL